MSVIVPRESGGWWHHYICPTHGIELEAPELFTAPSSPHSRALPGGVAVGVPGAVDVAAGDVTQAPTGDAVRADAGKGGRGPGGDVAPGDAGLLGGVFPVQGVACRYGCRWDTPEIRGAWTVLAHQACAGAATVETLKEYEELYFAFAEPHDEAQQWMLRGRLFQQALTEAIWAVRISQAARRSGNPVPRLLEALAHAATQAREKLIAQGNFRSNFTAWLNAAGWLCSGDPSFADSQAKHVLEATAEDGWEWEGSTYYHDFVLRAYELTFTSPPPAGVAARLAAMREVSAVFRGVALHDSPYSGRTAASIPFAEDSPAVGSQRAGLDPVAAQGAAPYGGQEHEAGAGWARPLAGEASLIQSLAQWVPGRVLQPVADWSWWSDSERSPGRTQRLYPSVGYAVLEHAGIKAVLDFGPHGGSHGHRDKLALYLYPWQPDPGQVPYGQKAWREHYASTRAHPTFRIDELEQAECAGYQIDEHTFGCDEAYPGVRAVRRVTPVADGLVDELTVTCDRPRKVTLQMRPAVPVEVTGMSTLWDGTLTGQHSCTLPSALMVKPGPGPADDPQRTVSHLDWTVLECTEVTFRSEFRCFG